MSESNRKQAPDLPSRPRREVLEELRLPLTVPEAPAPVGPRPDDEHTPGSPRRVIVIDLA